MVGISKKYASRVKECGLTNEDLKKSEKFMRIYNEYKDTRKTIEELEEENCDTNDEDYVELLGIAERFDIKLCEIIDELKKEKEKQAKSKRVYEENTKRRSIWGI